jgi:hypothetical protein
MRYCFYDQINTLDLSKHLGLSKEVCEVTEELMDEFVGEVDEIMDRLL